MSSMLPGLLGIVERELAMAESIVGGGDVAAALLSELHLGWLSAQLNRLLSAIGSAEVERMGVEVRRAMASIAVIEVPEYAFGDVIKRAVGLMHGEPHTPGVGQPQLDRPRCSTKEETLSALAFMVRRAVLEATICRLRGDGVAALLCDLQLRWLMGYLDELRVTGADEQAIRTTVMLRARASAEIRDLRAPLRARFMEEVLARTRVCARATPPIDATNLLLESRTAKRLCTERLLGG